ncbi:MAG: phosphomannomutase/phosphoglucomutase [Candidatus Eisenbacteria bacterium]|uniref:Phosphomannomutase/phosphoglucomutase n=1 Tax=Eiseniibacteriota bacterium TaxID=2212470 RepID=A0A956SC50_UNCEI|nr:phosphomannomutase/phosphoglucomutase [Candidatus Eisenbacteria bacterium]MCB9462565.1 phosphomannomutase/phosphoglucomutase [Candidatus Eisenbacteria bacterium]
MEVTKHVFREYDVRGIAETELTNEFAEQLGKAFGSRLRKDGAKSVVIGRDVRESSPRLAQNLGRGLMSTGLEVIDLGIIPTPGVYYGVNVLNGDGGVVITGSHNPIEFNGFKMQVGKASIYGDEILDLARRIEEQDFVTGEGSRREVDLQSRYEEMIVEKCKPARKLKVVLDAGNGVAGPTARAVFHALGYDVTELYLEPDGNFPNHQPDPTVEKYMTDLKAKVREVGADVGCGFDGDGDRIGIVTEEGKLLYGDQLLALFARDALTRDPGAKIVFDVKCSKGLEEDIAAHGGKPIMWKTGHSLTKAKMKAEHAPVAGEMSGHMFFSQDFFGHDDALYAAARFVAMLSKGDQTVSQIVDTLPKYVNSPEVRIECPDDRKFAIVDELAKEFARDHDVIDIDGARVSFEDGWGLVRPSNTQPVLVLRFEAKTAEGLERISNTFRNALSRYPEVRWTE